MDFRFKIVTLINKPAFKFFVTRNLFIALIFSASLTAKAQEPKPEQVEALLATIERSFVSISSQATTPEQVNETVSDLIKQFEVICKNSCSVVHQALTKVNQIAAERNGVDLSRYTYSSSEKSDVFTEEGRQKLIKQLDRALKTANPEEMTHKVDASFQLVKFIQQSLFSRIKTAQDNNSPVSDQIHNEFKLMKKQVEALFVLKEIISKNDSGTATTEDAKKFAKSIENLGLFYKKFAQSLSNTSFILGPEISKELKVFQDANVKIEANEVVEILKKELGKHPREVFVDFNASKPLAVGTIAQTYSCKIRSRSGRLVDVIVKVQRPGLSEMLEYNGFTNRFAHKVAQIISTKNLVPVLDAIAGQVFSLENEIRNELDFQKEARNMQKFHRYFAADRRVKVPEPIMTLTTKNVLVMTQMDGKNIDSWAELNDSTSKLTPKEYRRAFKTLLDAFLYNALITGEMHADLHPGNVLSNKNGSVLSLIDVSQIFKTKGLITQPVRLVFHLLSGNKERFAKAYIDMGSDRSNSKEIREIIVNQFEKHQIEKVALKNVFSHDHSKNFEKTLQALQEIITLTIKAGFAPTPRYFQLFRSSIPIIGSLVFLGNKIPRAELKGILVERAITFVPRAAFRYGLSIPIHYSRRIYNAIWERTMIAPANPCRSVGDQIFNGFGL